MTKGIKHLLLLFKKILCHQPDVMALVQNQRQGGNTLSNRSMACDYGSINNSIYQIILP